ncbi:hypothetical protein L6V77_06580 [Myxococcota bacterium]|nr:hypothetical protein [Myxococcota bacterium]
MTEPVALDPQILASLNDQLWRRVGITQTFDRLLVEAVVLHPGPIPGVRQAAGKNLTGGAAKFYEMSFPQLMRDLIKRGVLVEKNALLAVHPGFVEKIRQVLAGQAAGQSHVEPTPGMTIEGLQVLADLRAEREKLAKAQRAREAPEKSEKATKTAKGATTRKSSAEPRKRASSSTTTDEGSAAPAPAAPAPAVHRTAAHTLFTSLRINKLLDVLDTGSMNHDQLGGRLDLNKRDLERFLSVADALGLTRLNGPLIELHWQGRELAKTTAADRRVKVTDYVKMLRDKAAELDA